MIKIWSKQHVLELMSGMRKQILKMAPARELLAMLEYYTNLFYETTDDAWKRDVWRTIGVLREEVLRRTVRAKAAWIPMVDKLAVARQHLCGADFIELLLGSGLKVTQFGNNWKYNCPFHGDGVDREPSGVLYPDEMRYHCFGCNKGGDIFQWMQDTDPTKSFVDCLNELYSRFVEPRHISSQIRQGKDAKGLDIL